MVKKLHNVIARRASARRGNPKLWLDCFASLAMTIVFLGISTGADALVLDSQFITKEVINDITNSLKEVTDGKIEVSIASLPCNNINVPPGNIEVKTEFDIEKLRSSSIARVRIYVDDVNIRNFGVKTNIKIYKKVWVAKDRISKGSALGSLRYEKKEVSSMLSRLPEKDFSPAKYIARRNIQPGKVIASFDVEGLPTIVRNSPVSVIFKTSKISVTVPAIALTSGKTGDFIKVRSDAYRKVYVGKIIGANIVLVNI